MKKFTLLLTTFAVLTGGGTLSGLYNDDTTVPDEVAKRAVYPPKPRDYKKRMKRYLHHVLENPGDARYRDWIPAKASPDGVRYRDWTLSKAYLGSNPPTYGWVVSVNVNLQESSGAYTGDGLWVFWFHGSDPVTWEVDLTHLIHVVEIDADEWRKNYH